MKITVILFSYNRPEMLLASLKHLNTFKEIKRIVVLDDCSKYDSKQHKLFCDVYDRNQRNQGKRNFYKQWKKAFKYCKESPSDIYLFAPDDFQMINIQKVIKMHQAILRRKAWPYAFNIINDGRRKCWTPFEAYRIGIENEQLYKVGFVDCGFFCNHSTLVKLQFEIDRTPDTWFDRPTKSSGVGWQLSRRLFQAKVDIYQPCKSFAIHGDHPSVMHPHERKTNPLISR